LFFSLLLLLPVSPLLSLLVQATTPEKRNASLCLVLPALPRPSVLLAVVVL